MSSGPSDFDVCCEKAGERIHGFDKCRAYVSRENRSLIIEGPCLDCWQTHAIWVDERLLDRWSQCRDRGSLLAKLWPHFTEADKRFFLDGICPKCEGKTYEVRGEPVQSRSDRINESSCGEDVVATPDN